MEALKKIALDNCKNFKEFFVQVCEIKISCDYYELKELEKLLDNYLVKYGTSAIIYLKDVVLTERLLPMHKEAIKFKESEMRTQICKNFKEIFPEYHFICTEKAVQGIGRINIFAMHDETPVLIEVAIKDKYPNARLLAYKEAFNNPILISITEEDLDEMKKIKGIQYFTFEHLKRGVKQWIE